MNDKKILDLLYRIDDGYEPDKDELHALRDVKHLHISGSVGRFERLPESLPLLANLHRLTIWGTMISSLKPIAGMQTLKQVFLMWSVPVTDLSPLAELFLLERLTLWNCPIEDLSPLSELRNLSHLNLQETNITTLLPLANLSNLVSLNISKTKVVSMAPIQNLPHLKELYMTDTPIADLSCIASLKSLRLLEVNCPQTCHPDLGKWIPQITSLSLGGSPISDLSSLQPCTQLEELGLGSTNIHELPDWLGQRNTLYWLGLANLSLRAIPASLLDLNLDFLTKKEFHFHGDTGIYLTGTTLAVQPISLFEQDRQFLASYYRSEKVPLKESKVIFLGDGGVGKTHTILRLRNGGKAEEYDTETTKGIDITPYEADYQGQSFHINFWDFGGQEIMHAMHRCFLTERTCYVIVLSNRADSDLTARARFWLRNVQSFAPKARVLLALNRWEGVAAGGINMTRLLEEYKNLCPEPVYYSAKCSTEEEFGRLTQAIVREAATLDSASMEFPRQWANIRRKLLHLAEKENYIDRERYHEICAEEGLEAANIRTWLLEWFNDLGVCFSYHQDKTETNEPAELATYKVLNPRWLTNAIYTLINHGQYLTEDGRLHRNLIRMLLQNPELGVLKGVTYDDNEQNYVLDIMRKFKLSYQVSDTHEFIPAICSENTPKNLHPADFPLHVAYQTEYTFLPDSVVHQLMIRCYSNLNFAMLWRKGMRMDIQFAGLCAVVDMGSDDSTLRIDVYGAEDTQPWRLLQYLRTHISEINRSMGLHGEDAVIVRDADYEDTISIGELLCAKEEQDTVIKRYNKKQKKYFRCDVNDLLNLTFGETAIVKAQELAREQQLSMQVVFNNCTIGSVDLCRQSTDGECLQLITYLLDRQDRLEADVMHLLVEELKKSDNAEVQKAAIESEKEPKKGLLERLKSLLNTTGSIAENSEKTFKAGKAVYKAFKSLAPVLIQKLPELAEFIRSCF